MLHAARSFRPFTKSEPWPFRSRARGQKHPSMPPAREPPAEAVSSARRLRHVLPKLLHQTSQQPAIARDRTLLHPDRPGISRPPHQRRLREGFSLPLALVVRPGKFLRVRDLPGLCSTERGARPLSTDQYAAASSLSPPLAARPRGSLAGIARQPFPTAGPCGILSSVADPWTLHATDSDHVCSEHRCPRRTAKTAAHDSPAPAVPARCRVQQQREKGAK